MTATHCNTKQHTATCCNTLHCTATHCNPQRLTASTMTRLLQHTAGHCNTQHETCVAVCCSVLQCVAVCCSHCPCISWWLTANTMARRLPHTATRSVKSVLQATPCNMWQHSATYYNILCTLCVAVYCCVLQCGAVWCSVVQSLSASIMAAAGKRED